MKYGISEEEYNKRQLVYRGKQISKILDILEEKGVII